jgi:hypothetical protein
MKNAVAVVVLLALVAVPAFAGDGNVSQGTLSSLGLGGIQTMSDAQGMQVRGQASAFAAVKGTSLIFGQLLTPDTKNFVSFSSVNEVDANAETTAASVALTVTKDHSAGVAIPVTLTVTYDGFSFTGAISGLVGGLGAVSTGP